MRRAASRWMRSNEITVQFEEATAIRLLIAEDDPVSRELACRWVQEWVDRLAAQKPPAAVVAGAPAVGRLPRRNGTRQRRQEDAGHRCRTLRAAGTIPFLLDSGRHVVATLAALRADHTAGRWHCDWPNVRADFLDRLVNAEVVQRI
jgi:hypothetical protein